MEEKYIYFKIPESYKNLYYKLISYVASQGYNIMNDCSCLCKKGCRQIFNMWALFQSACALYVQGETDKSKFFIDYINKEFEHYIKVEDFDVAEYPSLEKQFVFYVGVSKVQTIPSVDALDRSIYSESSISITVPSSMGADKYLIIAYPKRTEYVLKSIMKGVYDVSESAFDKIETEDGLYTVYVSKYPGNFEAKSKITINMNSL